MTFKLFTRKAKAQQPSIVAPTPQDLRSAFLTLTFDFCQELRHLAMLAEINGYKISEDFYNRQAEHAISFGKYEYFVKSDLRELAKNNH